MNQNASVSMYMGFGGTNFAFYNGANLLGDLDGPVSPQIQSYDYDAPVSESGSHNVGSDGIDKFLAIQKVLQKFRGTHFPKEPPSTPVFLPEAQEASRSASLFDMLDQFPSTQSQTPVFMERLNQFFGYRHQGSVTPAGIVTLPQISDRVTVYVNESMKHLLVHGLDNRTFEINELGSLDFLVENVGRCNFGLGMNNGQNKGLEGDITHSNGKPLMNFSIHSIDFTRYKISLNSEFSFFFLFFVGVFLFLLPALRAQDCLVFMLLMFISPKLDMMYLFGHILGEKEVSL